MDEISAGAIIFRREDEKIKFLLLKYTNYWGFTKGNIEKDEGEKTTVKREIEEETGIKKIKFVLDFKEIEKYVYKRIGKLVNKKVIIYWQKPNKKKLH